MKKPFSVLLHLVRKDDASSAYISIPDLVKMTEWIAKISKKFDFECYIKWEPKDTLDYIPTGNTYELKTLEDIAKLTEDQFEMLIDDLRQWCNYKRAISNIAESLPSWTIHIKNDGMTWIDSGKHESKVSVTVNTSNKL